MKKGREKDARHGPSLNRTRCLTTVVQAIARRRVSARNSSFSTTNALLVVARNFHRAQSNIENLLIRSNRISISSFTFNFNKFSDYDCLSYFRFRKEDISRVMNATAWPTEKTLTSRNRYAVNPVLSTCILLRRLASPARWRDLEEMFGKHASQLSEIFWESVEHLLDAREQLLSSDMKAAYLVPRLERLAAAVYQKSGCLQNCVGFIDGTVLGIARPSANTLQIVAYNGHKRKHSLKYQALNTADGMIAHVYGPVEGRRHDWTLYVRSNLEDTLPVLLDVNDKRYCIFGDSGYSRRWFLEVPFQGSNLTAEQKAFNKAMSAVRITVEWVFKEIKCYFTTMDYKRKMKALESPVGMLYKSAMILCNIRNCIYPNQIARYFNCTPPTLEEYLNQ